MKIQFIVPAKLEPELVEYLSCVVAPDVDIVGLSKGGVIESRRDLALILPETLETIVAAEKGGCDAVCLACLSDTGLEEGRELVNIPVLAPLKVSMHVCSILGHKFAILVPNEYMRRYMQELITKYGFDSRGSVRTLKKPMPPDQAQIVFMEYKKSGKRPTSMIEDLVSECMDAIKEDDAEVLGMGCGSLVWLADMVRDELGKRGYDIPVLNPWAVTIEIGRALVNLKLKHGYIIRPPIMPGMASGKTT